jgi:hypothetical protein
MDSNTALGVVDSALACDKCALYSKRILVTGGAGFMYVLMTKLFQVHYQCTLSTSLCQAPVIKYDWSVVALNIVKFSLSLTMQTITLHTMYCIWHFKC